MRRRVDSEGNLDDGFGSDSGFGGGWCRAGARTRAFRRLFGGFTSTLLGNHVDDGLERMSVGR